MKKFEEILKPELRNKMLFFAAPKPETTKKNIVSCLITFYIMLVVGYFFKDALVTRLWLEIGITVAALYLVLRLYDYFYYMFVAIYLIKMSNTGVMVDEKNTLRIISGESVLQEIESDEVHIRTLSADEIDEYFPDRTRILDFFKDGTLIMSVGIDVKE